MGPAGCKLIGGVVHPESCQRIDISGGVDNQRLGWGLNDIAAAVHDRRRKGGIGAIRLAGSIGAEGVDVAAVAIDGESYGVSERVGGVTVWRPSR